MLNAARPGLGWRPELAGFALDPVGPGFLEVLAEHVRPQALPLALVAARRRGVEVAVHGVSLGLGGASRPDRRRLRHLAAVAESVSAPVVSEHVAFVRAGRLDSGYLMPVPRSRAALDVLVANVREAQAALPAPLALENIASLVAWPDAELAEADFLSELVERTEALLLLDLANLHANARNLGADVGVFLDRLPLERVAYVHVAGGVERGGHYIDTHAHPVPQAVLDLVTEVAARRPGLPVMIERDGRYPRDAELASELDAVARAAAGRAPAPAVCGRRPIVLKATSAQLPAPHRSTRRALARLQRDLLAGLLRRRPLPEGIDAEQARAAAALLTQRRLSRTAVRDRRERPASGNSPGAPYL